MFIYVLLICSLFTHVSLTDSVIVVDGDNWENSLLNESPHTCDHSAVVCVCLLRKYSSIRRR